MKLRNVLSPLRLLNLVKKDIYENTVKTAIGSGAAAGIIIIFSAYTAYTGIPAYQLYNKFFAFLLFTAGLIITSGSFREMHLKNKAQYYLLLPASHFEKFLSRLLLTTIGFSLFTLFGTVVVSYISEGLNTLLFNRHNPIFNPFTSQVWLTIARYTVLQSIFFLGAVYFRKNNFIKTINVLLLSALILSIIVMLLFRHLFADILQGYRFSMVYANGMSFLRIVNIFLWIVPAPLFWTIAYFRITEAEVKNAV